MRKRKGQSAGNAAVLVLLIAIMIIMFILFLRPEDRAAILDEPPTDGFGGGGTSGDDENLTLLEEPVGRLDYINFNKKEHELPSFRIFTNTAASEFRRLDYVYVKSAAFEKKAKNVSFEIRRPENVQNMKLSFNVADANGALIILLNGREIFYSDLPEGSPAPIELPTSLLMKDNVLTFKVSSPGWQFWRVNVYSLRNLQVLGDVTDLSGSEATQYFTISEMENANIDTATLFFYPGCQINDVGKLTIKLNGRQVYSSVADCGIMNHVELDTSDIFEGSNKLEFETIKGSYLLDQVQVKTELKSLVYPVYYFTMEDKYFEGDPEEREELCGLADDVCPDNCNGDEDKDCCYEESRDNYWCDMETTNTNDRCVEYVDSQYCFRCLSGYEDYSGDAAETCEGLCGDDNDDLCPVSCSGLYQGGIYYDKDCCYISSNEAFFWCDDVPIAGLKSVCEEGVSSYECDDCPNGYRDGDGRRPTCKKKETDLEKEEELKKKYDTLLKIKFVDEEIKKLDVIVNGFKVYVDTNRLVFTQNIDDYVRTGTNSIELIPKSDNINIAELNVEIED